MHELVWFHVCSRVKTPCTLVERLLHTEALPMTVHDGTARHKERQSHWLRLHGFISV